jgi:predicted DNA-binding protein (UPF0251 family)
VSGVQRQKGRRPLLTPEAEERLRQAAKEGVSREDLARRFGVSRTVVSRVITEGRS